MRIRSLSQLTEFLDDELAWRKKELTTLKFMLGERRQHEKALLLRAAICVLYAHWEGFVKAAASGYVSFVITRGLRYRDLTPNFAALGLRSEISTAGESKKPTIHTALATEMRSGLSKLTNIDLERAVSTGSNLNTAALNEIICLVGLDGNDYLTKKQLLDHKLVGNRNLVAHGRPVEIEADEYSVLHEEIVQLVQKFRTDIENAATTEGFRSVPSGIDSVGRTEQGMR